MIIILYLGTQNSIMLSWSMLFCFLCLWSGDIYREHQIWIRFTWEISELLLITTAPRFDRELGFPPVWNFLYSSLSQVPHGPETPIPRISCLLTCPLLRCQSVTSSRYCFLVLLFGLLLLLCCLMCFLVMVFDWASCLDFWHCLCLSNWYCLSSVSAAIISTCLRFH